MFVIALLVRTEDGLEALGYYSGYNHEGLVSFMHAKQYLTYEDANNERIWISKIWNTQPGEYFDVGEYFEVLKRIS